MADQVTNRLDRSSGLLTPPRSTVLLLAGLAVGVAAGLLVAQVRTPAARAPQAGQGHAVTGTGSPTPSSIPSAADGGRMSGRAASVDRTSRTQGGAVAAAARYATFLAQVWPLSAARARESLSEAATTSYGARLVAAVSAQLVPLQDQVAAVGGSTTYRQSVLATHMDTYHDSGNALTSDATARVSVWTLLVIAQVGPTPDAVTTNASGGFVTTQIDLRYERGAWRMSGSTDHSGPTPLLEGTPSTGNQMAKQLSGFRDWRP